MAYKISWPSCSICGTTDDPIYMCRVCGKFACTDHYRVIELDNGDEICSHDIEEARSTGWSSHNQPV